MPRHGVNAAHGSALSNIAHTAGLSVSLKNSGDLLREDPTTPTKWEASLIAAFDYGIIESCLEQTTVSAFPLRILASRVSHAYAQSDWNMCALYDGFLKAGKPQILLEYENFVRRCPSLPAGRHVAVYSGLTVDTNAITLSC